jgi:hypothetical protein
VASAFLLLVGLPNPLEEALGPALFKSVRSSPPFLARLLSAEESVFENY